MHRVNKPIRWAGGIILVLLLLMAGCTTRGTQPQETGASSSPTPTATSTPTSVLPTGQPNATKQPGSVGVAEQPRDTAGGQPNQTVGPVIDSYTKDMPVLMGIAIGDSTDQVKMLHGSPDSTYVMEEETPITVWVYEHFLVGFDVDGQVEFVEIMTDQVDPGLGGLRLGSPSADIAKRFGIPDHETDYVISYTSKTAILKFDIDRRTQVIQSIKLFQRVE